MANGQDDNTLPTWQNPSITSEWPAGQPLSPMAPGGAPTPAPAPDITGGGTTLPSASPDLTPQPAPAPSAPVANSLGLPPAYASPANRGGPVKNALTRMMYGMGQAMMAHVGLPTDYDIQRQQFAQQIQANDLALKQQAQQFGQQMVDTPMGPMPQQTWQKIGGSFLAAQARQNVADISGQYGVLRTQMTTRYLRGPLGIYDTQPPGGGPPKLLPQSGPAGAVLTPEVAGELGIPADSPYIGQFYTPPQLNALGNAYGRTLGIISSTTDPTGLTSTTVRKKAIPGQPGIPSAPTTAVPTTPGATALPSTVAPLPTSGVTVPKPPAGLGGGTGTVSPGDAALLKRYANTPVMDAAVRLVEGNTDPTQIPMRGPANMVTEALANAYSKQKYGRPFDMAQAAIDFNYAKQPSTQNTLKYLNSLTGSDNKSGNLQRLIDMSNSPELARFQWPAINDLQAWARLQGGSGPQAAYAGLALETADQVGKILSGGASSGTSDKKLNDAQALFQKGFNTEQMKDVATALRGALGNRKTELIGNNRYLLRQFEIPVMRNGQILGYTVDGKTFSRQ